LADKTLQKVLKDTGSVDEIAAKIDQPDRPINLTVKKNLAAAKMKDRPHRKKTGVNKTKQTYETMNAVRKAVAREAQAVNDARIANRRIVKLLGRAATIL
jgi:hypothetical protein